MRMQFLLLIIILNLNSFPQAAKIDGNNFQSSSNLQELKYHFSSDNLILTQQTLDAESILFSAKGETQSKKSPWLAFGLSIFYPGLGQLYNGEYGKALLMGGLGTVGLGLFALAAMSTDFDSESNPDYIGVMLYSGVVIGGGAYLWSLINAPIAAGNINEQRRKSGITIFSTEKEQFSVKLKGNGRFVSNILELSFNF